MHGHEAADPTPVDTFRLLSDLLKRRTLLSPSTAAKHMANVEEAFGPEVVEEAMPLIERDNSMERGTYRGHVG